MKIIQSLFLFTLCFFNSYLLEAQNNQPNHFLQPVVERPTSYEVNTSSAQQTGLYRIQLGVFRQMKSNEELATIFQLTDAEAKFLTVNIHTDFTKVNNVVCRRYYYGLFTDKADAELRMKGLEEASGEKLKVVKL